MRTAAEIINASDSLCAEDVFEIQDIIDEAVAHGMTISAEICQARETESDLTVEAIRCKHKILTARDNKVWRKE